MDDIPIRASVGRDGKPRTFEELLDRKLTNTRHSTTAAASRAQPTSTTAPSSSHKPAKRVSFTHSTLSPLSRSQRQEGDEESKENGSDVVEQEFDEDEVDAYRRIEDTLRTLRVEAETDAIDDSKYDDDDDTALHSTADLVHTRDDTSEAAHTDDAEEEASTGEDESRHQPYNTDDTSRAGRAVESSGDVVKSADSADERLRRQRTDAYTSYARSAKPLKTKREDNPADTHSDYHSSPASDVSHFDDVGIVHASAISPAIAQLFFQPPAAAAAASSASSSSSSSPSLSSSHSRNESVEWGVGSGYGKGRARVSMSEKPASKQTGKRLQPHRTNHYLTSTANPATTSTTTTASIRPSMTSASTPSVTNGQSLPSALHAQLNALQQEMSQYQAERNRLATLQHETQRELHLIKQERQQLTSRLQQQKADWDKQRAEEEKRLKRERVELERRKREAAGWKGSVREERGRVEELEDELARRDKEWREKDAKYRSTIERMRREMREMQAEVKESRDRALKDEKKRVDEWERSEKERDREKDAERRRRSATSSHYHFATVTPHTQAVSSANGSAKTSPRERASRSMKVREIVVRQAGDEDEKYTTDVDIDVDRRSTTDTRPTDTAKQSSTSPFRPPPSAATTSLFSPPPLPAATSIVSTVHHPANKTEHILSDRSRLVLFADGTRKHIAVDGSTRVDFPNGDYKICMRRSGVSEPHTIYYYASRRVLHRSYDGSTVDDGSGGSGSGSMDEYVFEDGQVERHWKDGRKHIQFADGSRKTIDAHGRQTTVWPDDDGSDEVQRAEKDEAERDSSKRWGVARPGGAKTALAGR